MKRYTYPGKSPAKFSLKRALRGGIKGGILGGGTGGLIGFFKGGNQERKGFQGTLVTGNAESSHNDYETENEVANLDDTQKDEILTQVVKEKKEAEASGDTGGTTNI